MNIAYRIVESDFGFFGIVGSDRGLAGVALPLARKNSVRQEVQARFGSVPADENLLESAASQLRAYFGGEPVRFSIPIDWQERGSDFERAVWRSCQRIPYGTTLSYGELAQRAMRPGAARAVGTAMAHNTIPIVIPCHRVCAAGGRLGGYSGGGGVSFKKRLLEMEAAAMMAPV